jgi:hypothetical protein
VILDVQQVIPLPEASEYQVRLREKAQRERVSRQTAAAGDGIALQEFWTLFVDRVAHLSPPIQTTRRPPLSRHFYIATGRRGFGYRLSFLRDGQMRVAFHIQLANPQASKAAFGTLERNRDESEAQIGQSLTWEQAD